MGREPAPPGSCSTHHSGRTTTKCHPQPHKTPGATDMERYNPGEPPSMTHGWDASAPDRCSIGHRGRIRIPALLVSRACCLYAARATLTQTTPGATDKGLNPANHGTHPGRPPVPPTTHVAPLRNATPNHTQPQARRHGALQSRRTTEHDPWVGRQRTAMTPVPPITGVASASQRSLSVAPVVCTRPAPPDRLFHHH